MFSVVSVHIYSQPAYALMLTQMQTMSINTEQCADEKLCMLIYRLVSGGGMQKTGQSCSYGRAGALLKLLPTWLLGDELEAEGQRVLSIPFGVFLWSGRKKNWLICNDLKLHAASIRFQSPRKPEPFKAVQLYDFIKPLCFHTPSLIQ